MRFIPLVRSSMVAVSLTVIAAALGCIPGCAGTTLRSPLVVEGVSSEKKFGEAGLTPSAVQSEVMSYTDTFVAAVSQVWNAIAANARNASSAGGLATDENAKQNRIRRAALEIKLANVNAALLIASSPNPLVSLADMITLVTLQRMVLESPSTEKLVGPEIQAQLVIVYKEQEFNAWKIADLAMTPVQRDELRQMITQWRTDHPDATYVSSIRLDDFASARQIGVDPTEVKKESLLSLLSLDPLSGLDPAQREVTKTRMLAERIFFYTSRVANVMKWQVESLYQTVMQAPEFKSGFDSVQQASGAAKDIAALAAKLPEQITKEREMLMKQFFEELSKERTATIEQINASLSLQRQAALNDLQNAQGQFQGTLKDFRETATTANTLAEKLTATIQAADALASRFAAPPGTAPAAATGNDSNGLDDVKAVVERTGAAADRLTELTKSIDRLLASPGLVDKTGGLQVVMQEVQGSGRELVNYAFWRLLIIVIVAPFAVVLAMGLYRRVVR